MTSCRLFDNLNCVEYLKLGSLARHFIETLSLNCISSFMAKFSSLHTKNKNYNRRPDKTLPNKLQKNCIVMIEGFLTYCTIYCIPILMNSLNLDLFWHFILKCPFPKIINLSFVIFLPMLAFIGNRQSKKPIFDITS